MALIGFSWTERMPASKHCCDTLLLTSPVRATMLMACRSLNYCSVIAFLLVDRGNLGDKDSVAFELLGITEMSALNLLAGLRLSRLSFLARMNASISRLASAPFLTGMSKSMRTNEM